MIFLVVLVICLSILVLTYLVYKRFYLKQNKSSLNTKARKDILHQLKKEKDVAVLQNKNLALDVEAKSKELAISSMGVFQKNNLLKQIKFQLQKGDQKSTKLVISLIDKHLNKTDDWALFEDAFAHMDKNFIKTIKTRHPLLTSNDLRLCAYLKLNLSSKEIAPLLHISPKSVEVKRYRLRKKMSLSGNQNLIDYVLSIS